MKMTECSDKEKSGMSHEKSTRSLSSSDNPSSACHCDLTPHVLDKLGIRFLKEDVFKIILNRWCLVRLSSNSLRKVDTLVSACDFTFDYETIEDIPERKGKFEKLRKKWNPDEKQMLTLRLHENEGMVNMHWFAVKLHEISFCLHSLITETPKKSVSDWAYRTLFEKLLQLFGFNTVSQPFIETEETLLMGQTISSKADIICSRLDTRTDRPVICVCQTLSDKEDAFCPPRKKMKPDAASTSMTNETDTDTASPQDKASSSTNIGDCNIWTQHIGELLLNLDKSFRYDGILGITIEKTWVRFTYLEVPETTMKKIKERPANRLGSLNVDEEDCPLFCFSERYNYLRREDRKTIFNIKTTRNWTIRKNGLFSNKENYTAVVEIH